VVWQIWQPSRQKKAENARKQGGCQPGSLTCESESRGLGNSGVCWVWWRSEAVRLPCCWEPRPLGVSRRRGREVSSAFPMEMESFSSKTKVFMCYDDDDYLLLF